MRGPVEHITLSDLMGRSRQQLEGKKLTFRNLFIHRQKRFKGSQNTHCRICMLSQLGGVFDAFLPRRYWLRKWEIRFFSDCKAKKG